MSAVQDIDSILARRTEKRQLGNSKGNTFSTATFSVQEEEANEIADPREYWSAILPEAVASHDAHVRPFSQHSTCFSCTCQKRESLLSCR